MQPTLFSPTVTEVAPRMTQNDGVVERLARADAELPEGPWEVWSSCSFRRITGPDGKDGGVLSGEVQRSDGHPDLSMSERQLQALCDLRNGVRALLSERAALVEALERAREERDDYKIQLSAFWEALDVRAALSTAAEERG